MVSRNIFWKTALCVLSICAVSGDARAQAFIGGILQGLDPLPEQPGEETWTFVNDLKAPLWSGGHGWIPRTAAAGEIDLIRGVHLDARFPDPEGLLKTAYADLSDFWAAGKVPTDGSFPIETAKVETPTFEAYRIEVTADRCRILAADTEGIRRGIFKIEDLMLEAGGPFLPLGTVNRKPFIKSRISRCFFGPINRPPRFREELMDDVDYYPDQYLNRMAHEGINGLWLSVRFMDIVKTSVVPEFGKTRERRLAKLRKTVDQCRRYGIRIYLYTNEPEKWSSWEPDHLKNHPELASDCPDGQTKYFCPSTAAGARYLYEAVNSIFSAVPNLGGMINITHGESTTSCMTTVGSRSNNKPACRACAKKENAEVIRDILSPMAKGMNDANPDAELIAWFYMPDAAELGAWVYDIPKRCPKNVTLQFNFESGVTKEVFGKGRKGSDYWLSTPGPAARFERLAGLSQQAGVPMSAKIQTGCSHEVASVPFVPVPGLLYRKFSAMRELGVSRVMLCWYFGNYPGIMNKAAGELSFEPFPATEEAFLDQLARPEWGKRADKVSQAWRLLAEGYGHFPLITEFQYWGPMHDGVVWPLLLRPQDAPLMPTWMLASWSDQKVFPPSGDRVGEALGQAYSLAEAIEECRAMSDLWSQGLSLLREIEADSTLSPQRRLDIGVVRALDIQFRSGLNILRFYDLRERLAYGKGSDSAGTLMEMRQIVDEELKGGDELIRLCQADSRLGFHSEAEGYKYFPAKIRWRMNQLQALLDKEIPALERELAGGTDVFATYTGRKPDGPSVHSLFCADIGRRVLKTPADLPGDLTWQTCAQPTAVPPRIRWTCCHDYDAFYLLFDCDEPDPKKVGAARVFLTVEPRRLWPCLNFYVSVSGKGDGNGWMHCEFQAQAQADKNGWCGWIRIPFVSLGIDPIYPKPLRINVRNMVAGGGERSWIARKPWPGRLLISTDNPADLGWLFFDGDARIK